MDEAGSLQWSLGPWPVSQPLTIRCHGVTSSAYECKELAGKCSTSNKLDACSPFTAAVQPCSPLTGAPASHCSPGSVSGLASSATDDAEHLIAHCDSEHSSTRKRGCELTCTADQHAAATGAEEQTMKRVCSGLSAVNVITTGIDEAQAQLHILPSASGVVQAGAGGVLWPTWMPSVPASLAQPAASGGKASISGDVPQHNCKQLTSSHHSAAGAEEPAALPSAGSAKVHKKSTRSKCSKNSKSQSMHRKVAESCSSHGSRLHGSKPISSSSHAAAAPISSSRSQRHLTPTGPRVRLGGRVLSGEEAAAYLKAAADAAAKAAAAAVAKQLVHLRPAATCDAGSPDDKLLQTGTDGSGACQDTSTRASGSPPRVQSAPVAIKASKHQHCAHWHGPRRRQDLLLPPSPALPSDMLSLLQDDDNEGNHTNAGAAAAVEDMCQNSNSFELLTSNLHAPVAQHPWQQQQPSQSATAIPDPLALSLSTPEQLPANFIPTPDQPGSWQTLASTLSGDSLEVPGGAPQQQQRRGQLLADAAGLDSTSSAGWQHSTAVATPAGRSSQQLPSTVCSTDDGMCCAGCSSTETMLPHSCDCHCWFMADSITTQQQQQQQNEAQADRELQDLLQQWSSVAAAATATAATVTQQQQPQQHMETSLQKKQAGPCWHPAWRPSFAGPAFHAAGPVGSSMGSSSSSMVPTPGLTSGLQAPVSLPVDCRMGPDEALLSLTPGSSISDTTPQAHNSQALQQPVDLSGGSKTHRVRIVVGADGVASLVPPLPLSSSRCKQAVPHFSTAAAAAAAAAAQAGAAAANVHVLSSDQLMAVKDWLLQHCSGLQADTSEGDDATAAAAATSCGVGRPTCQQHPAEGAMSAGDVQTARGGLNKGKSAAQVAVAAGRSSTMTPVPATVMPAAPEGLPAVASLHSAAAGLSVTGPPHHQLIDDILPSMQDLLTECS